MRRADTPAEKLAAKKRVIRVLDAISDLHKGDLRLGLDLDWVTPLVEIGKNDLLELKDGRLVIIRAYPPPERSLRLKAQTGEALGRILEQHLVETLGFGEATLTTWRKRNRTQQLGGRNFS